jgi:hypothetical protein
MVGVSGLREKGMHSRLTLCLAAAAIGLSTITLPAAPATVSVAHDTVSYTQLVQGYYYYGDDAYYGHRPACPYRYYYACWSDPYGRPHCGCRPGLGYYLFRFY